MLFSLLSHQSGDSGSILNVCSSSFTSPCQILAKATIALAAFCVHSAKTWLSCSPFETPRTCGGWV